VGGRGGKDGLALPVDATDQAVCPAGQTDSHSGP